MNPETVLKLTWEEYVSLDNKEIARERHAAFTAAYDHTAELWPECEDTITRLKERLNRALKLFIDRHTPSGGGSMFHDEYYYEWLDEIKAKENATLDCELPLGTEADAAFAILYFSIEELVYIQCGLHYMVITKDYDGPTSDIPIRQGFIAELYGEWDTALRLYEENEKDEAVQKREAYVRLRMDEEGRRSYAEAQSYMESGEWSQVFAPLSRAADMQEPDAMVDMALARIYGQFGMATDLAEALHLLRAAADKGHARAAMTIWELHDDGISDIEGAEAQAMCELAAAAGEPRSAERLTRGFDLRPLPDILTDRAARGDREAMWALQQMYAEQGDIRNAALWLDRAIEAGQVDALLEAATAYQDEFGAVYNPELADEYLRRAAGQGSVKAILLLSEQELLAGDRHFWEVAAEIAEMECPDEATAARHKREFGWYNLAAGAGDMGAMGVIFTAYHIGYPVEKNDKLAFDWAMRAAEAGDATAMYRAAYLLENGQGTDQDAVRAVELYKEAAENGIAPAMLRLYEIYHNGLDPIAPNEETALRYLWMSGVGHP